MSCTTEIRAAESHFKLARRLVESLSTKYNFPLEEGWTAVCNTSVEGLVKKFKKSRKQNNPFRDITKQRTSFSLFTKDRRAKIAEQNPNASFTDLSKLVSKAWNALTDKEKQVYKDMEKKDKERYRLECDAVRATLAAQVAAAPAVAAPVVAEAPKAAAPKRVAKSAPVKAATPAAATPAKAAAAPKAAKATKSAPVSAPVSAPISEVALPSGVPSEVPVIDAVTLSSKLGDFASKIQQVAALLTSMKSDYKTLEKTVARELKQATKGSGKKRKTSANKSPSGFVKPTKISDELIKFLGKEADTEMSRVEVSKEITRYINEHKLKDEKCGRQINPDAKLSKLLKINKDEILTFFNLQRYLKIHFIKAVVPVAI